MLLGNTTDGRKPRLRFGKRDFQQNSIRRYFFQTYNCLPSFCKLLWNLFNHNVTSWAKFKFPRRFYCPSIKISIKSMLLLIWNTFTKAETPSISFMAPQINLFLFQWLWLLISHMNLKEHTLIFVFNMCGTALFASSTTQSFLENICLSCKFFWF